MTTGQWLRQLPWSVVLITAALMTLGAGGILRGDELAGKSDFFTRQMVWIILGLAGLFTATLVPYRTWKPLSYPLFFLSLALLVAVYFMPVKKGAQRWIPLGFADFQPSEMMKLAYMMALAHYLMYRDNYRRLFGLVVPFVLTLVPVGLILKEPDLGTSLVFLPVLFAMLFAAGARPRHLIFIAFLGVAVLPVLWMGMSAEQKSRVVTLFVQRDGGVAPKGDDYHLHQSKQVLALGGIWGSELGGTTLDDPMAYHLPAARTDFIFCLIGERWGLWGGAAHPRVVSGALRERIVDRLRHP